MTVAVGNWHVVIIGEAHDEGDGPEYTFLHPEGCALTWDSRMGVNYVCELAYQISMIGAEETVGEFDDFGWYRIRMIHEVIRGADWTEYDSHAELEQLRCPKTHLDAGAKPGS